MQLSSEVVPDEVLPLSGPMFQQNELKNCTGSLDMGTLRGDPLGSFQP